MRSGAGAGEEAAERDRVRLRITRASEEFRASLVQGIVKSTLGGVVFRLVGVALPLTMFTGGARLNTVLYDRGVTLGLGIPVAPVIAKMLTFSVSPSTGFAGGPIFPTLFISGTAGIAVHQVILAVPLGLAFTWLLAAIPGAVVPAPFSCVLLAAFLT